MVKPRALSQAYLDHFKCIGASCSDNCCKGWDVDLDQATFYLYKEMTNSPLHQQFQKDVILNTKPHPDGVDYGRMVLTKERSCPFLDANDWCAIQMHHGESALSLVCHNFPRTYNAINDVIEVSATLSCPEVARLVLQRQTILSLKSESLKRDRWVINQSVDLCSQHLSGHPAKYLNVLRELIHDVMIDSRSSFYKRMVLLGIFHEGLMAYHMKETVDGIPKYVDDFRRRCLQRPLTKGMLTYKPSLDKQAQFYSHIHPLLPHKGQSGDDFFDSLNARVFEMTHKSGNRKLKNIKEDLQCLQEAHLFPFLREHPYFLLNYCLHFMFKYIYPFSEDGDPYTAYTLLVCRVYIIQLYLIALAKKEGQLTLNLAIVVVQKITKILEHHREFFNELADLLMHTGLDHLSEILSLVMDESGYK